MSASPADIVAAATRANGRSLLSLEEADALLRALAPETPLPPADLPATAIQTVKAIHVELARAEVFLTYIHRHLLRLEAQLHAAPAAGPAAPPASPPPADGGV